MSTTEFDQMYNLLVRIEKKLDDQITKQEKDHDKVITLDTQMSDVRDDINKLGSKLRNLDKQVRTIALKVAGITGGVGGSIALVYKLATSSG